MSQMARWTKLWYHSWLVGDTIASNAQNCMAALPATPLAGSSALGTPLSKRQALGAIISYLRTKQGEVWKTTFPKIGLTIWLGEKGGESCPGGGHQPTNRQSSWSLVRRLFGCYDSITYSRALIISCTCEPAVPPSQVDSQLCFLMDLKEPYSIL